MMHGQLLLHGLWEGCADRSLDQERETVGRETGPSVYLGTLSRTRSQTHARPPKKPHLEQLCIGI
jgi:hypothetical protein